jgi:hypothetical protein
MVSGEPNTGSEAADSNIYCEYTRLRSRVFFLRLGGQARANEDGGIVAPPLAPRIIRRGLGRNQVVAARNPINLRREELPDLAAWDLARIVAAALVHFVRHPMNLPSWPNGL